jgi:hypothetical protein
MPRVRTLTRRLARVKGSRSTWRDVDGTEDVLRVARPAAVLMDGSCFRDGEFPSRCLKTAESPPPVAAEARLVRPLFSGSSVA